MGSFSVISSFWFKNISSFWLQKYLVRLGWVLGFLKEVLDCGRSVANLSHDWTTRQDQAWLEIFLDCPNIFKEKVLDCGKSVANSLYERTHCKV